MKLSLAQLLVAGALWSACALAQQSTGAVHARDALSTDPRHYRLQFENGRTRVLGLTLEVNEVVPLHDDPDTLFVCVSDSCHIRFTQPDGYVADFHMQDAGQTRWIRAQTRSERNVGIDKLEMVLVEFKQLPASTSK